MTIASLYNALPTLNAASKRFTERDTILASLAPLLAQYPAYAAVLVHAHCTLESNEAMVANGLISAPTIIDSASDMDNTVFPERWLVDGTPFEFSRTKVAAPPAALASRFRSIVGDDSPLGLGFIGDIPTGRGLYETQEGRSNICEERDIEDLGVSGASPASWAWVRNGGQVISDCNEEYFDGAEEGEVKVVSSCDRLWCANAEKGEMRVVSSCDRLWCANAEKGEM